MPWRAHPLPQSDPRSRISNIHAAILLGRGDLLRSTESAAKFQSLTFFGFAPNLVGRCKSHFARPLFSWSYELLFPQLFCFDKYLRCPQGVGCTLRFQPQVLYVSRLKTYISPFLTYCCELLVVAKKINSCTIKQIQTLLLKYPGWGVQRVHLPGCPLRTTHLLFSSYRFRHCSTPRLLHQASLPVNISRTHRIAFSCAARLSAVRWNCYGNY
jgi:hypothetical protein